MWSGVLRRRSLEQTCAEDQEGLALQHSCVDSFTSMHQTKFERVEVIGQEDHLNELNEKFHASMDQIRFQVPFICVYCYIISSSLIEELLKGRSPP